MRWAGLSPKAFVQALTIDHARRLLRESANVLDAAHEVGLSGPGRLHDLFVSHEGMSPGAYKAKGKGLIIRYGFHDCPFGKALLATGLDARMPTGDEYNFLGAGSFGARPFLAVSMRRGNFSPHANFAYQWNGNSILAGNFQTGTTGNQSSTVASTPAFGSSGPSFSR